MVYGSFVDMNQIADEAGCSTKAAYNVADAVLRALHRTALINGLSGSLQEAFMHISAGAAFHLGGIYAAIGEREEGFHVSETLLRLPPSEGWEPFYQQMNEWEQTLNEQQREFLDRRSRPSQGNL